LQEGALLSKKERRQIKMKIKPLNVPQIPFLKLAPLPPTLPKLKNKQKPIPKTVVRYF